MTSRWYQPRTPIRVLDRVGKTLGVVIPHPWRDDWGVIPSDSSGPTMWGLTEEQGVETFIYWFAVRQGA